MCRTYFDTTDLSQYFERLARDNQMPSLDQLETMATRLFKTYSTTAGYWRAVHPRKDSTHPPFPLGDPCVEAGADMQETPMFVGDWALANSILLMRDGLWFLEVCQAMTYGDIRQVWEVLKVSDIVNIQCNMAYQQSPVFRYG